MADCEVMADELNGPILFIDVMSMKVSAQHDGCVQPVDGCGAPE